MLFFAARGSISPLFQIRMNADIKLAEHVKIPAINATASIAFSKEANTHTDTAAINARSLARRPDAYLKRIYLLLSILPPSTADFLFLHDFLRFYNVFVFFGLIVSDS